MSQTTLHIRQDAPIEGTYPIRLTLERPGKPDLEAEAAIEFALSPQDRADIRWYMEDYLKVADAAEAQTVRQIEDTMDRLGVDLFEKVLEGGGDTANERLLRRIFDRVWDEIADLRVEIATGVVEAASIPWELMREPESDSAIALRAKSFVRVQSNPNIDFVDIPPLDGGRVRLLYIACRPGGAGDVELRAVANRLLQGLGADLARFDITALRPPTFEQLQEELKDAKEAGRPYHIVHFDGHGVYADLSKSTLADWLKALSMVTLGGTLEGEHGYLLFEHPGKDKMRPVDGKTLGELLHDTGVPVLLLNACQSAMHEATATPKEAKSDKDTLRAIGSLAQAVVDQGIPAVLGMRYSVYVVTAAQYIGELYANLAKGRGFGEAASEGRKHLQLNPDRWVGLKPRPLRDWSVPVVYEAGPIRLIDPAHEIPIDEQCEMDPLQSDAVLRMKYPKKGFVGRDETLLALDRAFDDHRVVLLHAYAGQGKTTTAIEFARWYAQTGGLGRPPRVVFSSFERKVDLRDILNQIGQSFVTDWSAINDITKMREAVVRLLRESPLLWIWDNAETVAGFPGSTDFVWTNEERSELADFLAQLHLDDASKVKLLLTSRRDEQQWLDDTPHRIPMRRMSVEDASTLALQLGKEHGVTREAIGAWRPLLDYCQGNPLTLRVLVGQALKEGRREEDEVRAFVEAIRSGEKEIDDEDRDQGRDRSLGASLDYGFRHAFSDEELPIIALLHLFQGTVDVDALHLMGNVKEHALPELEGKTKEHLTGLLERAKETGLLTHIGSTYYSIHPALPWFLKSLYDLYYSDSKDAASPTQPLRIQRAWVEAVGALGSYYFNQYEDGTRDVIQALVLEEANLLHARRLARRHEWWPRVISAMQGLRVLYQHHGRNAELVRLVHEIVPDFSDANDDPIPGREEQYSLVMEYRVRLARQERDLDQATTLQEKVVELHRSQAADVLALPEEAELDAAQRHRLRTVGVSVFTLGQILREQGKAACVGQYQEATRIDQRIEDTAAEAADHFNLGHAHMQIPDIRDLDAAEAEYRRSLELSQPDDALGRSKAIKQIGMVHHERFNQALKGGEAPEAILKHAQAAERHYHEALNLCPADAVTDLGPMHGQLGILYKNVGQVDQAREHYDKATLCFEKTKNYYNAGTVRFNVSLMYESIAQETDEPRTRRDMLERAKAYAVAALRDFEHYEGRAADDEAKARAQIADIDQALAAL